MVDHERMWRYCRWFALPPGDRATRAYREVVDPLWDVVGEPVPHGECVTVALDALDRLGLLPAFEAWVADLEAGVGNAMRDLPIGRRT